MKLRAMPASPLVTLLLLLGFVNHARAQPVPGATPESTAVDRRGQGYAFYSICALTCDGQSIALMHVGGGGEALVYRGLGLGAELGYLMPHSNWVAGIGVLSLDGSYHFARHRKWVPFITGGYSLGFRSGRGSAINCGGGVNYWYRPRQGIRIELRDILDPRCIECHSWGLRIGFAFR